MNLVDSNATDKEQFQTNYSELLLAKTDLDDVNIYASEKNDVKVSHRIKRDTEMDIELLKNDGFDKQGSAGKKDETSGWPHIQSSQAKTARLWILWGMEGIFCGKEA